MNLSKHFVIQNSLMLLFASLTACGQMKASDTIVAVPSSNLGKSTNSLLVNPSSATVAQAQPVATVPASVAQLQPVTPQSTETILVNNNNSNTAPAAEVLPARVVATASSSAVNFDPYHPVAYSVSADSQALCSQMVGKIAAFPVSCRQVNAYNWRADFLAPISVDQRTDTSLVETLYLNSDSVSAQRFNAAKLLRKMYLNALNREPDLAGFYFWLNEYFGNDARPQPAKTYDFLTDSIIKASQTYLNAYYGQANPQVAETYGRMLYIAIFERQAEQEGLQYWVNELVSGRQGVDQVKYNFYLSTEFRNRLSILGLP